jgi:hypothetical protein
MALVALVVLLAQPAFALTTTCEFNEATQQIDYSISDGAGVEYNIDLKVNSGCSVVGTPPNLNGPDDAASVDVSCEQAGGTGYVQFDICQGTLCFATYRFNFVCDGSCGIRQLGAVPSYTDWSIAGMIVILLLTGAVLMRRQTATA